MNLLSDVADKISNFAKLERILAVVCIIAPALLISGDNWNVRPSISDYYNMQKAVLFYVPLTVAFMLFIVNGVIMDRKFYNTFLGMMLAGLVIFNHTDFKFLHFLFAGTFFLGNAYVIVKYSPKHELWFKAVLVALIGLAIGLWLSGIISLFWAEWISLGIIGIHYILESLGIVG